MATHMASLRITRLLAGLFLVAVAWSSMPRLHAQVVPSPCPEARLLPAAPDASMLFGRAVALGDGFAAVGALLSDGHRGRVHLFEKLGPPWKEWVETASFSHAGDTEMLGLDVDATRDTVLATAFGAAYVFERTDAGWVESAVLPTPGSSGNELPCALTADHAAAGSPGEKLVRIFARDGFGGWFQQALLGPQPTSWPVFFGESLALTDDLLVVGDRHDTWFGPDVGSVHVYVRDDADTPGPLDDTWVPRQMLFPTSTIVSKGFGTAVAVDDDEIIVGAPEADAALYVFRRDLHCTPADPLDDTWLLDQVIADPGFVMGEGLALDGQRLLVRSEFLADGVLVDGTRVFERSVLAWSEVGRMTPFEALDLSRSVALSGRLALLGQELYGSPSGTPGMAWLFDIEEPSPWTDEHHGLPSDVWHVWPRLAGQGALHDRFPTLTMCELPPDVQGYWVVGTSAAMIPFHGGVIVPAPQVVVHRYTPWQGGEDEVHIGDWPKALPSCIEIYIQFWMLDAIDPNRWSATNAIVATQP